MASPERLSNDEFFTQLTTLFATTSAKEKNSVYLTQKVLLPFSTDNTPSVVDPTAPLPLLFRATNGQGKKDKIKFSTVVEAADLEVFFTRYAEVAKAGMATLKKRDRRGRKLKARKKGKVDGAVPVAAA